MFIIRKYAHCWVIINDDTSESSKLTVQEVTAVREEFPSLLNEQVRSVFADKVYSIDKETTPAYLLKRKYRRNH